MLELTDKSFISAQPENRTVIEEALEFAWHDMLTNVEQLYPDLKQPLYTQDEFVSLLAGERGVLDWQPSDDDQQRRETADKAFDIHRKAGTRYGLRNALLPLGIDSVVTKGEQPYSVVVDGKLSDRPLTAETSQRMNARLTSYKSERDSIALTLSRSSNGTETKAAIVQTAKFIHVFAGVPVPPVYYGSNPKFGFVQSEKVIRVSAAEQVFN
ncbi:phage tail protein [Vibrio sp. S17_S38]|uniref:phage tail protein n=1 Tax=Vibrio sp. S17_S38 TaxID=2720229 RepID=UPI001680EAD5|nr:phage tail protein [Vibrio sp. S17_S38]MBD1572884.1 phage tail protein [Vibrio sp. S17_S38]